MGERIERRSRSGPVKVYELEEVWERPKGRIVRSGDDAHAILGPLVVGPVEVFAVLCLDAKGMAILSKVAGKGTANSCQAHPRDIFGPALQVGATSIIIAHSHPSGRLFPSAQDWIVVDEQTTASRLLGMPVLDHLIVCGNTYLSLKNDPRWRNY